METEKTQSEAWKWSIPVFFIAYILIIGTPNTIYIENEPRELAPLVIVQAKKTPITAQYVIAEVSAYTLGREAETDNTPCTGAYNDNLCEMVRNGAGVCASNGYAKGTILNVGGFECVVLDKMNRRYQNGEIDIAMLDYSKALSFGRQHLQVEIIEK